MPSYASPMKLDTSVVIIPHFCILGIWGRINLSHFLRCYALCCYKIYQSFIINYKCSISYKKSLNLRYIFLYLYLYHFYVQMHTCYHNLSLKT